MKLLFPFFFFLFAITAYGQQTDSPVFKPPFSGPLSFSGNFGEIRATHFHGGLDFRTGGAINIPIRALGDGYISKVRVNNGSGYIVEVTYDNGYRTINRHLEGLLPPFKAIIDSIQYQQESYEVEFTPEPDQYRVKTGESIGLSGNRGYSFGPHLHLDVIETETDEYVDPVPLFGNIITDNIAPKAFGFMLIPQLGKGVVDRKTVPQTYTPDDKKVIKAWGEIGAAVKAYDFMNGSQNRCGVHTVELRVDDSLFYRSIIDRFTYEESRQVNTWSQNGYMKSFITPGNELQMFDAFNGNNGLITIDEERDYTLHYTLTDVSGNQSEYKFKVRGEKQNIPEINTGSKSYFRWNKVNHLNEPGMSVVFPKGAFHEDILLLNQVKPDSNAIAYTYQLHNKAVSLFKPAVLQIGLRNMPVSDTSKYFIGRVTNKGLSSVGGVYEDGFIKANIRTLGTYTIGIDTVPPKVATVNRESWAKNGKIVLSISDNQTGISNHRATIDGKYVVLYRPNMMQSQYICDLNPKYIEKGKKHLLEVTVVDGCGNETIVSETFFW